MPGNPPRWLQALFWASLPSVLLAEMLPTIEPEEACEEFASPAAPLPWTLEDCIEVWNSWSGVQLPGLTSGYSDVDVFGATAEGLRRRGEPCVVQLTVDSDGAGSTSMRQLGAWMYAQEMGCTWITPYLKDLRFNKRNSETTVYCHPTATLAELDKDVKTPVVERVRRCEYVSWLEYFRFDLPSLPLTEGVKYNNIKVSSVRRFCRILLRVPFLVFLESLIEPGPTHRRHELFLEVYECHYWPSREALLCRPGPSGASRALK